MRLSIALITAFVSAVTAIPTEPMSDISIADRSAELLGKRACVPENAWFCEEPGARRCLCNQGKRCECKWIDNITPGGNYGAYLWITIPCRANPNGGLQCIDGNCQ